MSIWKRYGFAWVTFTLFAVSLVLHWFFGWQTHVADQLAHHQPADTGGYLNEMLRDTFENWQSEFLQLLWQVVGLTFLLFVGSPQSKEEDDRLEGKLDAILHHLDPEGATKLIRDLDARYPGRHIGPKL